MKDLASNVYSSNPHLSKSNKNTTRCDNHVIFFSICSVQ